MTTHGGRQPNAAAFTEFVRQHGDMLMRTAFGLTGNHARAEDVVQQALMTVYRKWDAVDDPTKRDAYARQVVRNVAKQFRLPRWRAEVPHEVLPDVAVDGWESAEARLALMQAIQRLPYRQREVVTLRFLEDMTQEAVAAELDVSVGTVKSQTSKAMVRLRTDPALRPYETAKERCDHDRR